MLIYTCGKETENKNQRGTKMKTIKVEIKNVYGNEMIYVVGELDKKIVATLTGKKTVSRSDISALRDLGITVELAASSVSL